MPSYSKIIIKQHIHPQGFPAFLAFVYPFAPDHLEAHFGAFNHIPEGVEVERMPPKVGSIGGEPYFLQPEQAVGEIG